MLPFRFLIHVPRRAVRLALWAVLLMVLAFFAVTRTDVGREVLKERVERAFSDHFEGRIEIGVLSDNLIYRLAATDVSLYDDLGNKVATIDSVVVSPRWRRILQGHLEFGRIYLYSPRIDLKRDSAGSWNLTRCFSPRVADTTASRQAIKSVAVGDLRILAADVSVANPFELPSGVRNHYVFDYTNAHVGIRDAHVTLDWRPDHTQIDIIHLSARMDQPSIEATTVEGQLVIEDRSYFVNQVRVETPSSRIRGSVSFSPAAQTDSRAFDSRLQLNLTAQPLDNDEIRGLLPSYPLRSQMDMAAKVHGPLASLVVEELSMSRGTSQVSASGTVVGLPDSLDFEVSITEGRVSRRHLQPIIPDRAIRDYTAMDSVVVSLLGRGALRNPMRENMNGHADFFVDVSSTVGQLSGRVSFDKALATPLTLSSDLVSNRFDVLQAAPRLGIPAIVSGDISIDGSGSSLEDLVASVEMDLVASSFQGREIDSLWARANYANKLLDAEALIASGQGRASINGTAQLAEHPARYTMRLRTTNLDVGKLAGKDALSSSLNAEMEARFQMSSIDDLVGTLEVAFDSSRFVSEDIERMVRPARITAAVEIPEQGVRRFRIRGDVAEADGEIRGQMSDLGRVADRWIQAITAMGGNDTDTLTVAGQAFLDDEFADTETVGIRAVLRTINTRFFNGFFPGAPRFNGQIDGEVTLNVSPETLALDAVFSGDSLALAGLNTHRYSGSVAAFVRREDIAHSLDFRSGFDTEWFSFGGSGISDLSIRTNISAGSGGLAVRSGHGERVGPLALEAALSLTDAGLLVTPDTFTLSARGTEWSLVESGVIRLAPGSVSTERLILATSTAGGVKPQRVELRGGISSNPDERLFARVNEVELGEVSNLLSLRENLGGLVSGTLTLFRRDATPVLESSLSIRSLRLDSRVLGDIEVSSQLQPGTSTVLLDIDVSPAADTLSGHSVSNQAIIKGTIRLPTSDRAGTRTDPGAFDLEASITRADMFFFEYIFPGTVHDVTGAVSGKVHISGSPSRPVFDAELVINDGFFRVPQFNLEMGLDGDVFVDHFGVHIRSARVVDKTGGTADITGDVLFNDYRYFSLNLYGQLNDFQIMDVPSSRELPFYGHIWGSGTASLSGPISAAELRASSVRTHPRSELYIPLVESETSSDGGFIIFADSTGQIPDLITLTRRKNVLASRPRGERGFTEGMDIEINIDAPEGSTVHLVIDPLLGDVINGIGSGRVQILRKQGEFQTFGTFQVNSGDYLFTAGEVFVRRFVIEEGGLITWDGDPTNALLDIPAAYRTRASRAGLGSTSDGSSPLIPVVVNLRITGRVATPEVSLALAVDRSAQDLSSSSDQEFLETILNDPQQSTEYATSVLLTNSFALTTTTSAGGEALGTGAFNSLSQLVATQLNRYLSSALPNVDFSFGVQGESGQELDITYGVALRLLDERLVIRGQGVYQGTQSTANEGLQGEFVVEVRLSNNVSVEVFYRREGDALASERILTSTTGAGVSYRTEFPTWKRFFSRLFGWLIPDKRPSEPAPEPVVTSASSATDEAESEPIHTGQP